MDFPGISLLEPSSAYRSSLNAGKPQKNRWTFPAFLSWSRPLLRYATQYPTGSTYGLFRDREGVDDPSADQALVGWPCGSGSEWRPYVALACSRANNPRPPPILTQGAHWVYEMHLGAAGHRITNEQIRRGFGGRRGQSHAKQRTIPRSERRTHTKPKSSLGPPLG